ncbi:MAG TPA: hypothetical protein VGW38_03255, partial [Chloroflexota bacterium]|nr:hypothetical protein [Chloroflexota bacterium]
MTQQVSHVNDNAVPPTDHGFDVRPTRRGIVRQALALASAGFVTSLAACAPGGSTASGGQTTGQADQAAKPAQTAKLTGKIHLMDWELGTGPAQERWAKAVARFKEKYPGITVEEDRSNEFWKKLPAVIAAGT